MRSLGSRLRNLAFTDDSLDGFILERVRDDFIEGRFIQKLVYEEVLSDPFGRNETVERTVYQSTSFTLFSTFPNIELRNAQRSVKDFVNKLLQACDFNLVVTPTTPDILVWVELLQKAIGSKVLVDSLQVSGVQFGQGVTGKILLKGERDVREVVANIVGTKQHVLEKLQVKVTINGRPLSIQLGNNGTAKFPPEGEGELRPQLRLSFPRKKR